jgi:predicted house-cleaning NTP pyrophosphatase (Maf/HAM1 superfamily)
MDGFIIIISIFQREMLQEKIGEMLQEKIGEMLQEKIGEMLQENIGGNMQNTLGLPITMLSEWSWRDMAVS